MEAFYLDKHNKHVHEGDCPRILSIMRRVYLGEFSNGEQAVSVAKKMYPESVACSHCIEE